MSYYAVKKGHKIGIYNTWKDCKEQITGFKGPVYKKFSNLMDAQKFCECDTRIIEKIDINPENDMLVFTDGGCKYKKGKSRKSAYAIYFGENDDRNVCEILDKHTHNFGELTAIVRAMKLANLSRKNNQNIIIITDSKYSMDSLTHFADSWKRNNWTKKDGTIPKNIDLIKDGFFYLLDNHHIKLCHVNSHTGYNDYLSIGNDKADKMVQSILSNS